MRLELELEGAPPAGEVLLELGSRVGKRPRVSRHLRKRVRFGREVNAMEDVAGAGALERQRAERALAGRPGSCTGVAHRLDHLRGSLLSRGSVDSL